MGTACGSWKIEHTTLVQQVVNIVTTTL